MVLDIVTHIHFLDIRNLSNTCPEEVAIFIHGWGLNETEAPKERLDRVKMSLEKNNYTHPLVGFNHGIQTQNGMLPNSSLNGMDLDLQIML